jgi:hypothetical protein
MERALTKQMSIRKARNIRMKELNDILVETATFFLQHMHKMHKSDNLGN